MSRLAREGRFPPVGVSFNRSLGVPVCDHGHVHCGARVAVHMQPNGCLTTLK